MRFVKTLLLVTLFLVSNLNLSVAQNAVPDSLVSRLSSINDHKARIIATTKKMRNLVSNDFESAISLADYNIEWAETTSDNYLIGKSYNEKSILYLMYFRYQEAKPLLKKGIEFLLKTDNKLLTGYALRNLGIAYFNLSNHDSSISAHFEALNNLDSTIKEHKLYYGLTCDELAKVFYESSSFESSKKYAIQALNLYSEIQDSSKIVDIFSMLALTHTNKDSSLYYLNNIIDYSLRNSDSVRLYNAYANYGNILIDLKDFDLAKSYSLKSFDWYRTFRTETYIRIGVNLANIYINQEKYDSANYYIESVLPIALEREDDYVLSRIYTNKSTIEKSKGNFQKALEYFEKATVYELNNLKLIQNREITSLELELEVNNKNKELNFIQFQKKHLEEEAFLLKKYFILLAAFSVLLIILLVFISIARTRLKRKNDQLIQQKDIIQNQNKELETLVENNKTLFSIIGHDLRSPINNIKGLLDLLPSEEDKISNDSKNMLDLIKSSVKTESELLENLLLWSKMQRKAYKFIPKEVSLKQEIEKIIDLNKSCEITHGIKFKLENTEDVFIKIDPFALDTMLRNLISNSIKFSPKNGSINFCWKETENHVNLSIKDEAGGLPKKQEDFLNTAASENNNVFSISKGLGLKLVKSLATASQVNLNYIKTEKGSNFNIEFKKS